MSLRGPVKGHSAYGLGNAVACTCGWQGPVRSKLTLRDRDYRLHLAVYRQAVVA